MKKLLFLLTLVLAFTAVKAQESVEAVSVLEAHYQTVLLDSADVDTVFFVFPNPRGYYPPDVNPIDTIPPTSESVSQFKYRVYRKFATTGVLDIHILPDSLNSDSRTDSLFAYVKFLSYNADYDTLTIIQEDSLFLDLDTPENYTTSTQEYLSWTKFRTYHSDLSGYLSGSPGIALFIGQVTEGDGDKKHKFYLGIWSQR